MLYVPPTSRLLQLRAEVQQRFALCVTPAMELGHGRPNRANVGPLKWWVRFPQMLSWTHLKHPFHLP